MNGADLGLDVQLLTIANFPALAELFAEGGDPRWCWCAFWRLRGAGGSRDQADQNRALLAGLAERGDPAPGLVALRDGRAVGWVSLGPRAGYPRLVHSKVLPPPDDRPVWSIVCFVVSRPQRGRGVAGALLTAAVEHARRHGAPALEAYPVETGGGRVPPGRANTGTVPMFTRAGFTLVTAGQAARGARTRPVMRRELAGAGPAEA